MRASMILLMFFLLTIPGLSESPLRWANGLGYRYSKELVKTSANTWEASTGLTKLSLISSSAGVRGTNAETLLSKFAKKSGWSVSPYQILMLGATDVWRLDHPGGSAVCFKNSVLKSYDFVLVSSTGSSQAQAELKALLLSLRNDPIAFAKNKAKAAAAKSNAPWYKVKGPGGRWTLKMPGSKPKFEKYHAPYYACEISSHYRQHSALFKVCESPNTDFVAARKKTKSRAEKEQNIVWLETGRKDRYQYREDYNNGKFQVYNTYVKLPNTVLIVKVSGSPKENFRPSPEMGLLLNSIKATR